MVYDFKYIINTNFTNIYEGNRASDFDNLNIFSWISNYTENIKKKKLQTLSSLLLFIYKSV